MLDQHITMNEAIEWLIRIGCTDVRQVGTHLIKGTMKDGYKFITDIREHRLEDTLADK